MVTEELPASPPMNSESVYLSVDIDPPTLAPPSMPPAETPSVDDSRPNADLLPPRDPSPQPPSNHHHEPTSPHEPISPPPMTQSVPQLVPQHTYAAEPPT